MNTERFEARHKSGQPYVVLYDTVTDVPLARGPVHGYQILLEALNKNAIDPDEVGEPLEMIIRKVCRKRNISISKLMSKSRKRYLVDARKEISARAKLAGHGVEKIGRHLNRHHSTIIHHQANPL